MRIFILLFSCWSGPPALTPLKGLEVRVLNHQPLRALALEAHLYACLRARALDVEHHALAELAVAHARPETHAARFRLLAAEASDGEWARHLHPRAHLLDQVLGDLTHEA